MPATKRMAWEEGLVEVNYVAWRFWADMGLVVIAGGNIVYTWWSNREKVNSKRFAKLEEDVKARITSGALAAIEKEREGNCERHRSRTSSIEGEIKRLDSDIKHLPGKEDISRVHSRIDEVLGSTNNLGGEMRVIARQVDLVLEELMRRGK